MTVTVEQLRTELRAGSDAGTTSKLTDVLDTAQIDLDKYIEESADDDPHGIPAAKYDQAWLSIAVHEFNRRMAPNGVINQPVETEEGSSAIPMRVSTDTLRTARQILAMWCADVAVGIA